MTEFKKRNLRVRSFGTVDSAKRSRVRTFGVLGSAQSQGTAAPHVVVRRRSSDFPVITLVRDLQLHSA